MLFFDLIDFRLHREQQSLDNIKQHYVVCKSKEDKYRSISNIYGVLTIGQAMIFCHVRKIYYYSPLTGFNKTELF